MTNTTERFCAGSEAAMPFFRQEPDKAEARAQAHTVRTRLYLLSKTLQEFVGWQLDARDRTAYAFTPAPSVTKDDFNWVFGNAAEITRTETVRDLRDDGRRTYALVLTEKYIADRNSEGLFDLIFSEPDEAAYRELFAMLQKADAVVRFCTSVEEEDGAFVFLSLPEEMTPRLKGMLSLVFRNTEPKEVSRPAQDLGERALLPRETLADSIRELTFALIYRPGEAEKNEPMHGAPASERSKTADSIETLDLSVRAYNCLMRAGLERIEQLRTYSRDDLLAIPHLNEKAADEILEKLAALPAPEATREAVDYTAQLEKLIGLEEVKEQVARITAFARMKKEFASRGETDVPVTLNMEFVGNPGTAKTTVARIVAGILWEAELLSCPEAVEVGRADLIAQYVGQTAVKVRDAFRRARGKVLFIDEAYALVDSKEYGFGDEAITTLVQEMENHRDETVVILAGYPDKMKDLFARNPGLRSRVPFSVLFRDYAAVDLARICKLEAEKRGFEIEEAARDEVERLCAAAANRQDADNGRFCRNLVESAILRYAIRVFGSGAAANNDRTLIAADFVSPEGGANDRAPKRRIGFCA